MQDRSQSHPGHKAQRVADVADRVAASGLHPAPAVRRTPFGSVGNLETPLLREEECDGTDVCVLVVANIVVVTNVAAWVAVEGHG